MRGPLDLRTVAGGQEALEKAAGWGAEGSNMCAATVVMDNLGPLFSIVTDISQCIPNESKHMY